MRHILEELEEIIENNTEPNLLDNSASCNSQLVIQVFLERLSLGYFIG